MPKRAAYPISADEILKEEFNYIAQTAAQANEDRARVSSFYFVSVGSLIAALFGAQFLNLDVLALEFKLAISAVFFLLTLLGVSVILQLARLRLAWYESALAMNQIKEFAVEHNHDLAEAFRWTTRTLPPRYKTASISFYQAREAAILSGVTCFAGMYFAQYAFHLNGWVNWLIAVICGVLTIFLQIAAYRRALR
ncbi:MAG: hypothetical protein HS124_01950 [Anaerolineales bacterium]|nr:hypothetical protein [Anaerolineales bacterium]